MHCRSHPLHSQALPVASQLQAWAPRGELMLCQTWVLLQAGSLKHEGVGVGGRRVVLLPCLERGPLPPGLLWVVWLQAGWGLEWVWPFEGVGCVRGRRGCLLLHPMRRARPSGEGQGLVVVCGCWLRCLRAVPAAPAGLRTGPSASASSAVMNKRPSSAVCMCLCATTLLQAGVPISASELL